MTAEVRHLASAVPRAISGPGHNANAGRHTLVGWWARISPPLEDALVRMACLDPTLGTAIWTWHELPQASLPPVVSSMHRGAAGDAGVV